MTYGSVCSGIEAATVAWSPLGWTAAWFSEIDPFCCALLKHHYPEVTNYGDFTKIGSSAGPIDLLVGGTPCQSFSVAGKRAGLDDPRGVLAFEFLALAGRLRPRWVVFENVPGLLSSNSGRDFGAFLGALGKLGYGWAYRVLDAQYFDLAQRRARLFIVGNPDWRRAATVLFERHSLSGHPPPRRETGERVAPVLAARTRGGGGQGTDFDGDGGLIAFGGNNMAGPIDVATGCNSKGGSGRMDFESETFVTTGSGYWREGSGTLRAREQESHEHLVVGPLQSGGTPRGHGTAGINDQSVASGHLIPEILPPLRSASDRPTAHNKQNGTDREALIPVAFETRFARNDRGAPSEIVPPLKAQSGMTGKGDSAPCVFGMGMAVRRLMPIECERLQGCPDNYTLIPYRGKLAADGPRYKAIGNSMAVPVMRWLGLRILEADR